MAAVVAYFKAMSIYAIRGCWNNASEASFQIAHQPRFEIAYLLRIRQDRQEWIKLAVGTNGQK